MLGRYTTGPLRAGESSTSNTGPRDIACYPLRARTLRLRSSTAARNAAHASL